jgi:hypothetical protein
MCCYDAQQAMHHVGKIIGKELQSSTANHKKEKSNVPAA